LCGNNDKARQLFDGLAILTDLHEPRFAPLQADLLVGLPPSGLIDCRFFNCITSRVIEMFTVINQLDLLLPTISLFTLTQHTFKYPATPTAKIARLELR